MTAILAGVMWYLIVVLIYVSLMVSGLGIFSYTCRPSVWVWRGFYSVPLPIFSQDYLGFFAIKLYEKVIIFNSLDINSPN